MRGRIPESTLTEIRDRADIVEVVGAHVGLKRVGRNHVGLCPFHAEKTPSFTVNDERGIFHCFGCGAGGNVFTFLMKMENAAFPDIVERLARRYGIELPERGDDDPAIRRREALYRLNEKAARFFQRHLRDTAEAEAARAYLAGRGIGGETADRFVLGYAPAGGEVLARRLRDAASSDPELGTGGRPLALARELGLVNERHGGAGHFDRFRGRLMFPITDAAGRVVGFGSRSVPGTPSADAKLPKYLNSPETPLYRKGHHLYGLSTARDAIRKAGRVIVVEGYFDVLALAEAGVGHVVASLGTALTVDQLHVLRRFTRDIVVCFDGDDAGARAAEKSLATFLEAGLVGYGAFLPAGDDPDTFVQREGADAMTTLLANATPLLDFYLHRAVRPESTVTERGAVAQQVAAWLRKITDPLVAEMMVRHAADRLRMPENELRAIVEATFAKTRAAPAASAPRRAVPAPVRPLGLSADAEELLVTLMLHDPEAVARVDREGALDDFDEGSWRALAIDLVAAARERAPLDAATVLGRLDEATAARVTGRMLAMHDEDPVRRQIVVDCLAKLRHRARERERLRVLRRIREAEAIGNLDAVAEGQRQLLALRQSETNERA
ncbi:MAG: DNA primase [Deltaproteobacteria bacterium]|nr:DNA primase [Deltaproteobacteria bacterium]